METLLQSKENELRHLRGELAYRDSTAQELEISLTVTEQRRLREQVQKEQGERREDEEKALSISKEIKDKLIARHEVERAKFSSELNEIKTQCLLLEESQAITDERAQNLEKENARRVLQLQEAVAKINDLKTQIAELKEGGKRDTKVEDVFREFTEYKISSEAETLSLLTKVEQKEKRVLELDLELREQRQVAERKETQLNTQLELLRHELRDKDSEISTLTHDLVLKNAEVQSLRERMGTETPRRAAVERTSSREDLLVLAVKRLETEIASKNSDMMEKVGNLKATNGHLEKENDELKASLESLKHDVDVLQESNQDLRDEIQRMKRVMGEKEKDVDVASNYLLEEISKVKQQKAQLRVEHLELKRKYTTLELSKKTDSTDEIQRMKSKSKDTEVKTQHLENERELQQNKIETLQTRVDTLGQLNQNLTHQLERLRREMKEEQEVRDTCKYKLEEKLVLLTGENAKVKDCLKEMDSQLEIYEDLCSKSKTKENTLNEKIQSLEQLMIKGSVQTTKEHSQLEQLRRDNKRLEEKAACLQEELESTHSDYRGELCSLVSQVKRLKESEKESTKQVELMNTTEAKKIEQEKELRQLKEKIDGEIREKEQLQEETNELSQQFGSLQVKCQKLTVGLGDAVDKAERFKAERDELASERDILIQQRDAISNEIENTLSQKEVDTQRSEGTIAQQTKLITYLQTQLQAPTKKKGIAGFLSVERSPDSGYSSRSHVTDLQDMLSEERKKNTEVRSEVRRLRNQVQDLQRRMYRMKEMPESASDISVAEAPLSVIQANTSYSTNKIVSRNTDTQSSLGTMRHNIPHRWKKFLVIVPCKCLVCMDGLQLLRHGLRCLECQIVAHRHCAQTLLNTCGLPMLYTEYYLDKQKTIPEGEKVGGGRKEAKKSLVDTPSHEGRMTGWVKMWRSKDGNSKMWNDVWGYMDSTKLNFYPKDDVETEPIESINLEKQRWKIHFQMGVEPQDTRSVAKEDVPFLVEIKITPEDGSQPYRLYLMAPTLPAKQRWVNALQVATTKRLFTRRTSSLKLQQSSFLKMDGPHMLNIHSMDILDSSLILGCEEGLFFTTLKHPSIPYKIAGISQVYQLQVIHSIDTVVVISGENRMVGFIHLEDLRQALGCDHPGVKITELPDVSLCHLFRAIEYKGVRHLCVADPDRIHIMSFDHKLQFFKPHKLETAEPVNCMEQMGGTILIGADRWLLVSLSSGESLDFLSSTDKSLEYETQKAPIRQDYPVGAVIIKNDEDRCEVLLSYQNYGIFVDREGRRSRTGNVDWARSPLQFVYTDPFLYVVHFESVEVFHVPAYTGLNSGLLEPRNLLDLSSPNFMGRGAHRGDVFFSSCTTSHTDILLLNAFDKKRRKLTERQDSDEKRHRSQQH